jgi:enoyl-[acyl-carrier-protein] reductase (NADH)
VLLQGFGWAIAKALAEAGAEISLGVWVSHPSILPLQYSTTVKFKTILNPVAVETAD